MDGRTDGHRTVMHSTPAMASSSKAGARRRRRSLHSPLMMTRILLVAAAVLLVVYAPRTGLAQELASSSSHSGDGCRRKMTLLAQLLPFPEFVKTVEAFANSVAVETGGQLCATNITYGVAVPTIFEAVRQGWAIGFAAPGAFASLVGVDVSVMQYLGNDVPFGLSVVQFGTLLRHTPFGRFWRDVYSPFGIKAYYAGTLAGPQLFGWYRRPIKTLADFRGLRLRYSGNPLTAFQGSILRELRAIPIAIPLSQLKAALANGTVDGVEALSIGPDASTRYWEAGAKVLHYPGLQGHEAAHFLVPADVAASADRALRRASEDAVSENIAQFFGPAAQAALDATARKGVAIQRLPISVVRGLFAVFKVIEARVRNAAANNTRNLQIIDEYNRFLKSTINHDIISDTIAELLPARADVARYVGVQVPDEQLASLCKK